MLRSRNRQGYTHSAPAASTALMTLRDSRHGGDGWPPTADGVLHTSSDAFVIRKPDGRPGVARHETALPLITDPCPDKETDNKCNGHTLDADGERTVAHKLDWSLHLQRPGVPICNRARRGATNLYGLWGTHNPPVVGSSPTRPTRVHLCRCSDFRIYKRQLHQALASGPAAAEVPNRHRLGGDVVHHPVAADAQPPSIR